MIPYVFPFAMFGVLFALLRLFPRRIRYRVHDAAAWSLSAMLLLTGGSHFIGYRQDLIRMVPPFLPQPELLVTMTGVLEWIGAALFVPRVSRTLAGFALAVLFVLLLPANIYAALAGVSFAGQAPTPLVLRVPEQLVYIAFALAPAIEARNLLFERRPSCETSIKQSERISI